MLLTQKYVPKKLSDIIGNEECIEKIKLWMLNWLRKERKKPLLIYGPPGIGKTSIGYVLRSEFDLELIEMNASDLRNKANIEKIMNATTLAGSLSGKKRILLIDDIAPSQSSGIHVFFYFCLVL